MFSFSLNGKFYRTILTLIFVVLFIELSSQLFMSQNSFFGELALNKKLYRAKKNLSHLEEQNKKLSNLIKGLHRHDQNIERQARYNAGLIKHGEIFYQFNDMGEA